VAVAALPAAEVTGATTVEVTALPPAGDPDATTVLVAPLPPTEVVGTNTRQVLNTTEGNTGVPVTVVAVTSKLVLAVGAAAKPVLAVGLAVAVTKLLLGAASTTLEVDGDAS